MTAANTMNTSPGKRTTSPRGAALLRDPSLNKGTAFSEAERDACGLQGLLPANVFTQEQQLMLLKEHLRRLPADLDRYIALEAERERNETLFYRAIVDAPVEMIPLVYTPTVGAACLQYSHIVQQPRGLFIHAGHRGRIAEVLRNWSQPEIDIIVVTDGSRILGLGDLGANGMGIPIGKLVLYTACAGIDPARCLPVTLDVGTDNETLLADPLYIGQRAHRGNGPDYDALIEEFVTAAHAAFPGVLIQFEDFANRNAFRLLDRYRGRVCAFNDDIQGTGAVVLAGLVSALRIAGGELRSQRILCLGAGGAATGLSSLFVSALMAEGLSADEARQRCWMFDTRGLVVAGRGELAKHKQPFAHVHPPIDDLKTAVRVLRPTALIGASTAGGAFSDDVLRTMAEVNRCPIVFALSNPTSKSECTAAQAYQATTGRALFASGSPFGPVSYGTQTFVPRQCNNAYIFPGVGLGLIAAGARTVTDAMFLAAAHALAAQVRDDDLAHGSLYPALTSLRDVSVHIAAAVARVAHASGLATHGLPADLEADIRARMYVPRYRRLA